MKRAKNATLVLCLFVLYCVLLSQGLKASPAGTFFGALAAVPLTVHIYHRLWPTTQSGVGRRRSGEPEEGSSSDRTREAQFFE